MPRYTIPISIDPDLYEAAKLKSSGLDISLAAYVRGVVAADLGLQCAVTKGRPRKPWLVCERAEFGGGIVSKHDTREQAEAVRGQTRLVLSVEEYDARVHLAPSFRR